MRQHKSLEMVHSHDMTEKEELAMRFTVVLRMSKCSFAKSPKKLIAALSGARVMFVF